MAFVTVHLHPPITSHLHRQSYEPISIYTSHVHTSYVHYILCRDNSHPLQAIFIPFRDYYPLSIYQGYLAYIRISSHLEEMRENDYPHLKSEEEIFDSKNILELEIYFI